jgi:hypothetical protein
MGAEAPAAEAAKPARPHRYLAGALVTVATIITFFACFAVWANRQALNTDQWTKTSTNLLGDHAVQQALSVYLVNQLFASTNVSERVEHALPGQLKGLSGPVAAGLREVASQAVPELLASPQVQEIWRRANRAAHKQFLVIINGGGKTVSTANGVVVLNLHDLVTQLAAQLGVSSQLAAARSKLAGSGGAATRKGVEEKTGISLPANTGSITILRANQLKTVQNIAKAIKGLALLLPLLALAAYALAIWLAEGRRRKMLRTVGWCLFGVGILLLLARRAAGEQIVNSLVAVPANRPAAEHVWSIGTSLLYNISIALVLYGVFVVFAAWLGGSTRIATTLRHASAPWLREHAVGAYGVAGGILLLIVLWGPTEATRKWTTVLVFALLFALGVTVLRRHTEEQFPDAQRGESLAVLRAGLPFWRHSSAQDAQAPAPAAAARAGAPEEGSPEADGAPAARDPATRA